LMGARYANIDGRARQGAAYVFTLNSGTWVQTAKLTASDGAVEDEFGGSVALAGNSAIVGADGPGIGSVQRPGAAYVFTLSDGTWTQTDKLTAGDATVGDRFGRSVAISDNMALVGATPTGTSGFNPFRPGAAYVFTRSGSTWTQTAKLTANDGVPGNFYGGSVALSGNTILIGARNANVSGKSSQGAAYLYTLGGRNWTHTAKLTAGDGDAGDQFGNSVALSGNTALVGAYQASIAGNTNQGAAYVFNLNPSTNTAPVLAPIADQSGTVGEPLTFTASATDADAGQTLTFSLEGAPAGASIHPTTGVFTYTPTAAGTFTFTVRVTDNAPEPLSARQTLTLIVTASPPPVAGTEQSILFARPSDKVVGETFTLVASAVPSGLPVRFFVSGPVSQSGILGEVLTTTGTGRVLVTAVQAGNDQYRPAPNVTRAFEVLPGMLSQTITFPRPADKSFNEGSFQLVATASSHLPVHFRRISGPVSVTDDGLVTFLDFTGSSAQVTVRAEQAGNSVYTPAPGVSRTFTITKEQAPPPPAALTFFRALNLNGPALTVDGKLFEASNSAPDFTYTGNVFANQSIPLIPGTDINRSLMLRSSIWGGHARLNVQRVPSGTYAFYIYVWEDNNPATFSLFAENQTLVSNYVSGPAGRWEKLGPFRLAVTDGELNIRASGGHANLSGLEIYRVGEGATPPPLPSAYVRALNLNGPSVNVDGLNFEDSRTVAQFSFQGRAFSSTSVPLSPAAGNLTGLIRSSLYLGGNPGLRLRLEGVPEGTYDVYLYNWEDNNATTFSLFVEGQAVLRNFSSGPAGSWRILGPYRTAITDGALDVYTTGGSANLSGLLVRDVNSSARRGITEAEATAGSGLSVYPVPTDGVFHAEFVNPQRGPVSVRVINLQGRPLAQPVSEQAEAGKRYRLRIDGGQWAQGMYLLQVQTAAGTEQRKVLLTR
jgi:hypothetical protein